MKITKQESIKYISLFLILFNFSYTMARFNTQKPLKILFVVGHFPSPSQTFILNIIIGMVEMGHDVSIFSWSKDSYDNMDPRITEYNLLSHLQSGEKSLKNIVHYDYDIVFCQFGYLAKRIIENKAMEEWLKKRKFVVCFRGSDISLRLQENPQEYKPLVRKIDLCLPVCDYFKKRLISLGFPSHKVIVHHSAIDCDQFFFTPRIKPVNNDTIHIIAVCRLVKKKGLDYAIKALAEVVKKHKNIHFTILGEGEERQYLELLIRQLKLQNYVTLFGWANQEQVVSFLNRSHIFVLPSCKAPDGNEEGIPNALKEAMAMGLITVATQHAGNSELIDDKKTGFLVPEKNTVKLAEIISYIIENLEEWEGIEYAARKKVEEEFETKRCGEKLEQIFYGLMK